MAEVTGSTTQTERVSRGRRVTRVVLSVVVLAVFLGIPAARFLLRPEPEPTPDPPAPVVVSDALRATAERTIRYSGNLTPETNTVIVPRVSGRVTDVLVRAGESVAVGEVVVRIEDEVLQLQFSRARSAYDAALAQYRQAQQGVRSQELEIARAEVDQAVSALDTARSNLARTERLYEAQTISRSEYEQAQDRFQSAETDVANARRKLDLMEVGASDEELAMARANADAAERQLDLARLQLDYAAVTTPVAGTVARVMVQAGQTVGQETPLAAVVNDRLIYAEVGVPERLYGSFLGAEGRMSVRVYPEAYGEQEPFAGTVSSVASVVDPASRTFEVEVAIPNDDSRLRPGMYVNVVFVLERLPGALQVPDTAIYRRDGRDVVYVLAGPRAAEVAADGTDDADADPGTTAPVAREVPVAVLDVDGPHSVVREGLAGDERVIVEGAAFLADGQAVEVVEAR